MPSPPDPKILDVTVRDGSYLIGHQFNPNMVSEIAKGLSEAGIQYSEISHGLGIGARAMGFPGRADDDELLQAAKEAAPDLKISVFISPLDYSLPLIPGLIEYFEIGRIGTNVDAVPKVEKIISKLKKYEKSVSIQLVRCHARPPEIAQKAAKTATELGADIIYVVDTFGSMTPEDVKNYVSAVKSSTDVEIGFHGHNNIGMGIPNTLTAWEAGATWLDASLLGVGRGSGNTILEALVFLLQSREKRKEIDLKKLCQVTQETILNIFGSSPQTKFIDLLFSLERLDFFNPQLLEIFATFLHVPLGELLTRLHAKMGDSVSLEEPHLREVLKDSGLDYDKLVEKMVKK